MSKCPPGVICFENFTFTFAVIALSVITYIVYTKQADDNNSMNEKTKYKSI